MKRICLTVFIAAVFVSTSVWANTQIQAKHRGFKKDGKMINCSYCHTLAKVPKPKVKQAPNMAQVNSNSYCQGPACHPLKK